MVSALKTEPVTSAISTPPKIPEFDPIEFGKISSLAEEYGYHLTVENGQLRFGPPMSWKKDQPPPKGTEVFICQIPRDFPMSELIPILFQFAKFYDVRMMFNFSKSSKGFAFCKFLLPSDAAAAIKVLNNYEIESKRNSKPFNLVVLPSLNKKILSIHPVPSNITLNQINQLLIKCEIDENCIKYIGRDENVYRKGVKWLISFDEHRSAALAKRKLMLNKDIWSSNFSVEFQSPDIEKSSLLPLSSPSPPPLPPPSTTTNSRKPLLPSPPSLLLSLPRLQPRPLLPPSSSKKKKSFKPSGVSNFYSGQRITCELNRLDFGRMKNNQSN